MINYAHLSQSNSSCRVLQFLGSSTLSTQLTNFQLNNITDQRQTDFLCNFHDFRLVFIVHKLDIQWNIHFMSIDPVALEEGSASVFGDRKAASLYSKLLCQAH